MKILITGSAGQLGSELKKILEQKYCKLGKIDLFKQPIEIIAADRTLLDISNLNMVEGFFENNRFDVVVNCAAFTDVDGCEKNPEIAFAINASGVKNLAVCAEKQNAKLVQISTDYVFDGEKSMPYTENDECNPINIYGESKLLGENNAIEYCRRTIIIRTAWLYGKSRNNFVKTMITLMKNKKKINVVSDKIGSPTSCTDLAFHILRLLTADGSGIYNCAGKGCCSRYDLAKKITEFTHADCEIIPCSSAEFPTIARRPKYSCLENARLSETFGDKTRYWQDALLDFIEQLKEEDET